ncbi:MAG: ABC transporter substrate-binding protein, partial [Planctomycetes bacterium]|nr:ABC transporter substrate-binding protein [Planctomycetota bacterium]
MQKTTIMSVALALIAGVIGSASLQNISPHHDASPEAIDRVICMSPAVTEIVFALGQGERVVGISQYVTYPPEALDIPTCGGFFNPNFEQVMALEPDLVLSQGLSESVNEFCSDRGINFHSVELSDLESVFAAIREIGDELGTPGKAAELCDSLREQLREIARKTRNRPRPEVLLIIGRDPGTLRNLSTAGRGSFLHDILKIAGGKNIFADIEKNYSSVGKEAVTSRSPEVIIELHGEGMFDNKRKARIREAWSELPSVNAVKTGRIYAIGATYALLPGPRLTKIAR